MQPCFPMTVHHSIFIDWFVSLRRPHSDSLEQWYSKTPFSGLRIAPCQKKNLGSNCNPLNFIKLTHQLRGEKSFSYVTRPVFCWGFLNASKILALALAFFNNTGRSGHPGSHTPEIGYAVMAGWSTYRAP